MGHIKGFFRINAYICLELKSKSMERFYINEFHRQWIENTLESLASWKKQPISLETVKEQQERLSRQKEARKKKNQFHNY